MKQITFILVVTFILSFKLTLSQEGLPIYTDYLTDNYYLIHPSMAGAANCSKVRMTVRQQWLEHDDSPKLFTLSMNGRLGESQSAIGGIAFADKNGYHSQKGAYVTYAHHIMFSRTEADLNQLSFGLSAGFIQYQLDGTSFLGDSAISDPIINGVVKNKTNFNVDFGFSYHFLDFYAHTTVKNLLKNSGVNNDLQITDNLRRFLLSVGGVFHKYGSTWSFEPSVMLQYKDGTRESSIDFNGKVYKDMKNGTLWGGLSLRQSLDKKTEYRSNSGAIKSQKLRQISPIVGIDYKNFMFAYTYTYQINSVLFAKGGFHQLTLGYSFNCRRKAFDCLCPAVN